MAVLVALSTVLATFLGGFLALRSRNRMHLVLFHILLARNIVVLVDAKRLRNMDFYLNSY